MFKYKILFVLCTLPASYSALAANLCKVGSSFTGGYTMPTITATTTNINKYETSSIFSNTSTRGVVTSDSTIFRVYDTCSTSPKVMRTIFGTILSNNVTSFGSDIYRLNSYPSLGVKVEMGDAPTSALLKTVSTTDTPIYPYDGDSHGLKIRVTLYVLPKTGTMTSYPSTINVNNLPIATINLKKTSDNTQAGDPILVYLNATVNISESTCTLTPTNYTIKLPEVSMRELGLPGSETSLSNSATLTINCANLNNGGGREIKAYMTDANNQSNAGNILQNQTGPGFATGVGIRLHTQNNNAIISFDPNQSKTTNKWTFGNLNTSTNIQHTIKANYIRTDNKVTPGAVYAQAYLNIVYD